MTTDTTVWSGADDLRPLLVPIEELTLLPGNPRRGDVDQIAKSLRRFGQRKPVAVNTDGVIVAGNHTFQAAITAGWTHLAVTRSVDLDPEEQRAYALADNQLSDLATTDDALLLDMLRSLDNLDGTGYTHEDLSDLEQLIHGPPDDESDSFPAAQATTTWPMIGVQVPPSTKQRWDAALSLAPDGVEAPHERVRWLLDTFADLYKAR